MIMTEDNEMMITSFKLSRDLYKKIKIHLLNQDKESYMNQSEFIIHCIERYFENIEKEK